VEPGAPEEREAEVGAVRDRISDTPGNPIIRNCSFRIAKPI
jgi:hypothetical protein